jgi:hypothetical protein
MQISHIPSFEPICRLVRNKFRLYAAAEGTIWTLVGGRINAHVGAGPFSFVSSPTLAMKQGEFTVVSDLIN